MAKAPAKTNNPAKKPASSPDISAAEAAKLIEDTVKQSTEELEKNALYLQKLQDELNDRADNLDKRDIKLFEYEGAFAARKTGLDERETRLVAREDAAERAGSALNKHSEHPTLAPGSVRITSKRDGFRRAGIAHTGQVTHEPGAFTPLQLEQLKSENDLQGGKLVVEFF